MSLASRLGFGRAGDRDADRQAQPSDDAIFLSGDAAVSPEIAPVRKFPIFRTLHRAKAPATPPKVDEAPYPSRFENTGRAHPLLEKFGLSRNDRDLASKLFGDAPADAPAPKPRPRPTPAIRPAKKKIDRSDITLGALGITLGLTCALFPWYIFFNQEKFGVREFVFEGSRSVSRPADLAYQPSLVGQPFQTGEVPMMDLDFFPTATLPGENEPVRAVPASDQPFPADLVNFRLVHVANGRAMIQDDDGLWIVQPGSRLPDASQVASIEQRNGSWVLVTTLDRVVTLEP